ncbi:Uncharacterised protein [Mycobacteroides abscessus subsp. abscessus]|uniref:hypothetical protein n=1 Tax=Mycobacteroides abscessus TaxID=36809 RepID=UPI0009CB217D|nr:hypothetical protein [Mycobacteroides abscessus]SKO35502.1 Uncharacterised protein [Mycobacteroides abscessus subsp. abscessus]
MSTTDTKRVPALRSRNDHPAADLPGRPEDGQEPRPEPENASPSPAIAETPAVATTLPTPPAPAPSGQGPAQTYGITYSGGPGLSPHNARIKATTKERLEAAIDTLRQRAREAGGDRRLVSLGSVTDRAIEEFLDRHCPDIH